jgi:ElaB/YqjD/DUF883 family membrane-anchored ribosome-binding protein
MNKNLAKNDASITALADQAGEAAREGLQELSETVPSALSRAAAQAEDLAQRGIARARSAAGQVREQYNVATDKTTAYIRDEPLKAVLIAAAAGAATALVASWVSRRHTARD